MRTISTLLFPWVLSALTYETQLVGLADDACLNALKSRSQLLSLQERPPASVNGLRYRVEADLPKLTEVLKAFSYYDGALTYEITGEEPTYQVTVFIHPGIPYKLGSYQVVHAGCIEPVHLPNCCPLTAEQLGLTLGKPTSSIDLVNGELGVLTELSRCGYPLAFLDKRRIEVDTEHKEVNAAVCVEEGPFSKFGPTSIFGLTGVHPRYIERRLEWREGEAYDSDAVAATQERLMNTNLFSSVYISHGEELDGQGELPMKLRLTEAKHRKLSFGVFYGTVDGPGVSFVWTNYNLRGMGEVLHFKGEVSTRVSDGHLEYRKPDFLGVGQTYRLHGDVSQEDIKPYRAFSVQASTFFDKKWEQKSVSVGAKVEHVHVSHSATNGTYLLAGLPVFAAYDSSDDDLNPTTGTTLVYQVTPYQSLFHATQRFVKQRLTMTGYIPLSSKKCVLALRGQFGSIAGAQRQNVPLPLLFLGGSIDELRGYRYKTVSPLNSDNQPLGGRSAVFLTAELRIRLVGPLGLVPFADFGTVTSSEIPTLDAKWFKSVGVGVRYFAFFGPLRFDVGFPLDRRKGLDSLFKLYASVGQAF